MTLDLKELECDMNTDLPNIGAKKRSGGRSARQALRTAPLAKELLPCLLYTSPSPRDRG